MNMNYFLEFARILLEAPSTGVMKYIEHNRVNFVCVKRPYTKEEIEMVEKKLGFSVHNKLKNLLTKYGDIYDKTTGGGLLPFLSKTHKDMATYTLILRKKFPFFKKGNFLLIAKNKLFEGMNLICMNPEGRVYHLDIRDMDDVIYSQRFTFDNLESIDLGSLDDFLMNEVFRAKK